jgi:DNA repair protein SbcC/Rad50
MIKKLVLKNFQSHKDSVLKFDKGFNVILGDSHSGKTAIIRAIRLMLENRPSGAAFYSDFAPESGRTFAKMLFYDGSKVELTKKVTRTDDEKKLVSTTYSVTDSSGETIQFDKMGKAIPDLVLSTIDLSDINIQQQHDQVLLLSASGSKLTQLINDVTGLGRVDEWQSSVASKIRSCQIEASNVRSELKQIKSDLKKYEGLEEVSVQIEEMLELENKLAGLRVSVDELSKAIDQYAHLILKVKSVKDAISDLEDFESDLKELDSKVSYDLAVKAADFIAAERSITKAQDELGFCVRGYVSLLKKHKRCPFCSSKLTDPDSMVRVTDEGDLII